MFVFCNFDDAALFIDFIHIMDLNCISCESPCFIEAHSLYAGSLYSLLGFDSDNIVPSQPY